LHALLQIPDIFHSAISAWNPSINSIILCTVETGGIAHRMWW